MKESIELYDKIERFNSDSMDQQERSAFLALMESDPELKAEVSLHSELEDILSDKSTSDFVDTLDSLRHKIDKAPPRKSRLNKYILGSLLVIGLGLLAWFLTAVYSPSNNEATKIKSAPVYVTKDIENKTDESVEKTELLSEEEMQEIIQDENILESPQYAVNDKVSNDESYDPASFGPNRQLELLIGSSARSNDISLELLKKMKDVTLSTGQVVDFDIQVKLSSDGELTNDIMQVYIFSNKASAYKDFLPLVKLPPALPPTSGDGKLSIKSKIQLSSGLYYYVIEHGQTEEILLVDKFEVRQ